MATFHLFARYAGAKHGFTFLGEARASTNHAVSEFVCASGRRAKLGIQLNEPALDREHITMADISDEWLANGTEYIITGPLEDHSNNQARYFRLAYEAKMTEIKSEIKFDS